MPGCKPQLTPCASAAPFLRVPVQVGESTPLQDAFLLADDVLRQVGSRRLASGSAAAARAKGAAAPAQGLCRPASTCTALHPPYILVVAFFVVAGCAGHLRHHHHPRPGERRFCGRQGASRGALKQGRLRLKGLQQGEDWQNIPGPEGWAGKPARRALGWLHAAPSCSKRCIQSIKHPPSAGHHVQQRHRHAGRGCVQWQEPR